jgi:hypothetical protein
MKDQKKYSIRVKHDGKDSQFDDVTMRVLYEVIMPLIQESKDCIFEGFSNSMPITLVAPEVKTDA